MLTYCPNNLLLNSATLSTQSVTVAPINYILSFKGTGTVTKSGTASGALVGTGVGDRVFEKFTPTAGTLTLTVSGSVTEAQLEAVTYQTTPRTYNATTSAAYYGPRFDHNPATLAARGLLIEEARTNVFTNSNTFTATATLSVIAADSVGPTGAAEMSRLTRIGSNSSEANLRYSTTQAINTANTVSVFAKAGSAGAFLYIRNLAIDNSTSTGLVVFNLSNGTFTSGASYPAASVSMINIGNGIYRCAISGTTPASIATNFVDIGVCNTTTQVTGTAGDYVFVYGAQLEAGSFATSYIPTAASSVARSADSVTMTGTNFSSWYNQAEGTVVVNAETKGAGSYAAYFSNGNETQYIGLRFGTSGTALVVAASGVVQANIGTAVLSGKNAAAFANNNFAVSTNGSAAATDTSGSVPPINQIRLGAAFAGGVCINGHISSIAYYTARLPNANLQSLTA